jgi:hypothetical protein
MLWGLIYHVYCIETSGQRQPRRQSIVYTWTENQLFWVFEQFSKSFGTGKWFQRHFEDIKIQIIFNVQSARLRDYLSKCRRPTNALFVLSNYKYFLS